MSELFRRETRIVSQDSPRWCDRCQRWGDHHSDRCTRPAPAPDSVRDNYNPNGEVRG